MKAAFRTTVALASEAGWDLVEHLPGRRVLLECRECLARKDVTVEAVRMGPAECHHPVVDDARPYEEDVACQRLVQEFGPMSNVEIAAAFGFTRERARQVVDKALAAYERRLKLVGLWEAYREEVESRAREHALVEAEGWACDF